MQPMELQHPLQSWWGRQGCCPAMWRGSRLRQALLAVLHGPQKHSQFLACKARRPDARVMTSRGPCVRRLKQQLCTALIDC